MKTLIHAMKHIREVSTADEYKRSTLMVFPLMTVDAFCDYIAEIYDEN